MKVVEYILLFRGWGPKPGWCHVIASDSGSSRRALIGEVSDNPGTSVTNALEQVAEAVAEQSFSGNHDFVTFQYEPKGLGTGEQTFFEIKWKGPQGTFHMPTWEPISSSENSWLEEAKTKLLPDDYTARSLLDKRSIPLVYAHDLEDPASSLKP